jgi:hypothetical protein
MSLAEAAQRGVACTRQIIAGIIEGAEYAEGIPVYVVDLIHSRFLVVRETRRCVWWSIREFDIGIIESSGSMSGGGQRGFSNMTSSSPTVDLIGVL